MRVSIGRKCHRKTHSGIGLVATRGSPVSASVVNGGRYQPQIVLTIRPLYAARPSRLQPVKGPSRRFPLERFEVALPAAPILSLKPVARKAP